MTVAETASPTAAPTVEALPERHTSRLIAQREFLAPVVAQAVAALRLPAGAWVLDAGTGTGGALPPLARASRSAGHVRAVDLDAAVLAIAGAHAGRGGVAARVSVESADVVDVLAAAATDPAGGFDAIWAGDLVGPGTFQDPGATVAAMARALRPGGVVALFSSTCLPPTFLPGHPELERLVRAASQRRRRVPAGGPHHPDQHLAWLVAAGLDDVTPTVLSRVGFPADRDPAARTHLECVVWPEMLTSATTFGATVGMTADDVNQLQALITPGSTRYVVDGPGYFVHQPTLLTTGRHRRCGRR